MSTSETATWRMTSPWRGSAARSAVDRPLPRSASIGLAFDMIHAGIVVKIAAARSVISIANPSVVAEGAVLIGMKVAPRNAVATMMRAPRYATRMAAAPPASASTSPLVSISRMSRRRLAPSAARIANWNGCARASSRLARFAHAMSKTSADTTARTRSASA